MCSAPLSWLLKVCVPHVKKKNILATCARYGYAAAVSVDLLRLRVAVAVTVVRAEVVIAEVELRELWVGDARVLWLAVCERGWCDTAARLIVWWYSGREVGESRQEG
jgi:hypothetical protein